ncbi:Lipopolysaccharide export system permease protein LptG [wastewater metagenome]|uniref:Lipopolysaccharide export system permease protein LptG n=2 Tax=unclassified sequences TaxID=12908 RepID=A0A5B8RIA4_9ZZZZ|nr:MULTISPECIES: LPS export ABC transporter permease LptG [Arhodomonas]MCS4503120.1 LPS export ABC transporter permease LptG [Arhodomonas aquaeolei]QEA07274.1 lipopolysaccharide export system permease protein LptG [uncultured organism]
MSRLERHIVTRVLIGFGIAAAVLLPLFSLLDLAEQLEDLGRGGYGFVDALAHTALLVPRRLAQLAPFIGLLGGIVGLGLLAAHDELIALRAVGLSAWRLRRATGLAALALALVYVALQGAVAPAAQQHAIERRTEIIAGMDRGEGGLGLWLRDRHRILHIGAMRHGRVPVDVELFRLRGEARLARYVHAARAEIRGDGTWRLYDVTIKRFSGAESGSEHRASLEWKPFIDQARIAAMQRPPESLDPVDLAGYVAYLRASGSPSARYALVLWRKAGHGLLTIALTLLATAFVTGGAPRGALAPRLVLGAFTGIAVFIGDQILASTGLSLGLPPAAIALVPAGSMLVVGAVLAGWRR